MSAPSSPTAPEGLVARLARWVVHHRALAIGAWPAWLDRRMPHLAIEPPLRPEDAVGEDAVADEPALTR